MSPPVLWPPARSAKEVFGALEDVERYGLLVSLLPAEVEVLHKRRTTIDWYCLLRRGLWVSITYVGPVDRKALHRPRDELTWRRVEQVREQIAVRCVWRRGADWLPWLSSMMGEQEFACRADEKIYLTHWSLLSHRPLRGSARQIFFRECLFIVRCCFGNLPPAGAIARGLQEEWELYYPLLKHLVRPE